MRMALLFLAASGLLHAEIPPIPLTRADVAQAADPLAAVWKTAPVVLVALQRTPPLYATDAPAALEIPEVQVQVVTGAGKSVVRLEWQDPTQDATALPPAVKTWQSESQVAQSGATDRFFDACAVMVPVRSGGGDLFPSLQMGDAQHRVQIYFYDMTRGAAVLDASGRSTTRRTGQTFPARSLYAGRRWQVTLELPELVPGVPLAVAVWNGRQQDRDGRKYFSVWYPTR
jgi:hypothetical protein